MLTWDKIVAEARKLHSGMYNITEKERKLFLDAKFVDIRIEVEEGRGDKHIIVKSNSWIDATNINLFLTWLQGNGYSIEFSRIRSQK
jgi:hypothetical protein